MQVNQVACCGRSARPRWTTTAHSSRRLRRINRRVRAWDRLYQWRSQLIRLSTQVMSLLGAVGSAPQTEKPRRRRGEVWGRALDADVGHGGDRVEVLVDGSQALAH